MTSPVYIMTRSGRSPAGTSFSSLIGFAGAWAAARPTEIDRTHTATRLRRIALLRATPSDGAWVHYRSRFAAPASAGGAAKLSAVDAPFYLASASPRRLALLRQIGVSPRVRPAEVDETPLPEESARAMVLRLAEAKGRTVAGQVEEGAVVLAADTAVVLGEQVLGKPESVDDALRMLSMLRGRTHEVLTAVFLMRTDDKRSLADVASTRVTFVEVDDATLRSYVSGGEPMDKAGAYGIQGHGALLCRGIEGSWSNVVGLPVERLPDWFGRIGIDLGRWIRWS